MITNGHEWHDPELDTLLASARRLTERSAPRLDVDRLIAVAAATVEHRRARRYAVLRVVGVGLIVAGLAVWTIGFARGVADVVYSAVMFAVPALVVLRWQMEALDGGGLRPWATPATVDAWSGVARSRADGLAGTIDRLALVSQRLDTSAPEGLGPRIAVARAQVDEVRSRLERCREGAATFVDRCRTDPGAANWHLLRDLDPETLTTHLDTAFGELGTVVGYSARLSGEDAASHLALCEARRETGALLQSIGRPCRRLVDAFDTLHQVATRDALEHAEVLGVVRRATSAIAVAASGWGVPPAQRSATRTALLTQAVDDGPSWGLGIRRARAAGREAVLVGGE